MPNYLHPNFDHSRLYSGSISNFKKCKHVHGSRWIFCCFAHVQISVPGRVPVLGEYGGLGYAVEGHRWSQHHEWGYGEKEVNRNPAARIGEVQT